MISIYKVTGRSQRLDRVVDSAVDMGLLFGWALLALPPILACILGVMFLGLAAGAPPFFGALVSVPLVLGMLWLAARGGQASRRAITRRLLGKTWFSAQCMVVGDDGVQLFRGRDLSFVPYADLKSLSTENSEADEGKFFPRLVFELHDGTVVTARVKDASSAMTDVQGRLDRFPKDSHREVTQLLDRWDEDIDGWHARVRGVARGDYRTAALGVEELLRIAEDPAAAPIHRVAAALALSEEGKKAQKRVRAASQACAFPDLAPALREAADGVLGVRGRRLLEEAEAQGRAIEVDAEPVEAY